MFAVQDEAGGFVAKLIDFGCGKRLCDEQQQRNEIVTSWRKPSTAMRQKTVQMAVQAMKKYLLALQLPPFKQHVMSGQTHSSCSVFAGL